MINIENTPCYSTAEAVKKIGGDITPKRIEYLRNLRLLPRPIKVSKGVGTVGYYPDFVLGFIKEIEKEHRKGKTYPDMLLPFENTILAIDAKVDALRKRYKMARYFGRITMLDLTSGDLTETCIKPKGEIVKKLDINASAMQTRLNILSQELKRLFQRKDNTSSEILARIRSKVEQYQELKATLEAVSQIASYREFHKKAEAELGKERKR